MNKTNIELSNIKNILLQMDKLFDSFSLTLPVDDNQGYISSYAQELNLMVFTNEDSDIFIISKDLFTDIKFDM